MGVFTCTEDIDLLVVIGGDGTILRAVRELKNFSVPVLCINRGAVGFLAEMRVDEAEEWLPKFLAGEGVLEERNVNVLRKQNMITVKRLEDTNQRVSEKVTVNYDSRTKSIASQATQMAKTLETNGLKPRVDSMETSLGLIFEH